MARTDIDQLSGKTALVTGGTSGIGLATARRYATEGARVVVCGRRAARCDEVAAELGPDHLGIACDVTDLASIDRMVDRLADRVGAIDVIVAAAGITFYRPLRVWTEQDFDRHFDTNAKGLFFSVQKTEPFINDGGVIILVGSVAARLGQKDMAVYGASKAAAASLARLFSADLLDRHIRAFCLTPGPVDTPVFENGGLSRTEARAKLREVSRRSPIGRAGQADELAAVAAFLASDASSYMLGTEIVVDGGKSQL